MPQNTIQSIKFVGNQPPLNPCIGDMYYDQQNRDFRAYDGTGWCIIVGHENKLEGCLEINNKESYTDCKKDHNVSTYANDRVLDLE